MTRVVAPLLGSPFTFASLIEGQADRTEVRSTNRRWQRLMETIRKNCHRMEETGS